MRGDDQPAHLGRGSPPDRRRSLRTLRDVRSHRAAGLLVVALLAMAPLAACGGESSSTRCSLTECTVTLDRGVDAGVGILGVDVRLVGVSGDVVTLDINGQQVQLRVGEGVQVAGFQVVLQELTDREAVVVISQGGGDGG